jgi:putative transposase
MEENKIVTLRQPGDVADPLTEVLRNGARALLAQAVEAEVAEALAAHAHLVMDDGRRRLVRHGHMPERTIQTGIGPVAVRQPRVRDRGGADGERIRFSSTLLPPYARRTKSLDALLPILYLRGISSGDMQEALSALLGKDAPNLSPPVLARLKAGWQEEYERWRRRDLSARRYVYIWADGVYLQARMEPEERTFSVSDKRSLGSASWY